MENPAGFIVHLDSRENHCFTVVLKRFRENVLRYSRMAENSTSEIGEISGQQIASAAAGNMTHKFISNPTVYTSEE
jgi:hypothetical protein